MRVATFNVQHGRSAGGVVDVPLLAKACADLDVDVLALQEVDRGIERSGFADITAEVADVCGMHGVFGMATEMLGGEYGNALLARSPIVDAEVVVLPRLLPRSETRSAVVATVDGLRLANAHLAFQKRESPAQLDALAALGADVILGDLNLRPRRLAALRRAGYDLAGGGNTFPARPAPWSRIDHVAVRSPLRIGAVDVVETPCSDHLALVVEVVTP